MNYTGEHLKVDSVWAQRKDPYMVQLAAPIGCYVYYQIYFVGNSSLKPMDVEVDSFDKWELHTIENLHSYDCQYLWIHSPVKETCNPKIALITPVGSTLHNSKGFNVTDGVEYMPIKGWKPVESQIIDQMPITHLRLMGRYNACVMGSGKGVLSLLHSDDQENWEPVSHGGFASGHLELDQSDMVSGPVVLEEFNLSGTKRYLKVQYNPATILGFGFIADFLVLADSKFGYGR